MAELGLQLKSTLSQAAFRIACTSPTLISESYMAFLHQSRSFDNDNIPNHRGFVMSAILTSCGLGISDIGMPKCVYRDISESFALPRKKSTEGIKEGSTGICNGGICAALWFCLSSE